MTACVVNLRALRELVQLGQLADSIHYHLGFIIHAAVLFSSFTQPVLHSIIALFRKLSLCVLAPRLNHLT